MSSVGFMAKEVSSQFLGLAYFFLKVIFEFMIVRI